MANITYKQSYASGVDKPALTQVSSRNLTQNLSLYSNRLSMQESFQSFLVVPQLHKKEKKIIGRQHRAQHV